MAAIIAAVISAAAAAGSTYYSTEAAKKAAKKKSSSTTMPQFTPQGTAMQDQMLSLLFKRMGTAPQSASDFMARGPQPAMDLSKIPFKDRETLNIGPGLPQVFPQGVPPNLIEALQRLGVTQRGPSIRQDQVPGNPPMPEPMGGTRQ